MRRTLSKEVLYGHPAVAEAAVIGIPHDSLGQEVGAAVALKKGAGVDPDELRDDVKEGPASAPTITSVSRS